MGCLGRGVRFLAPAVRCRAARSLRLAGAVLCESSPGVTFRICLSGSPSSDGVSSGFDPNNPPTRTAGTHLPSFPRRTRCWGVSCPALAIALSSCDDMGPIFSPDILQNHCDAICWPHRVIRALSIDPTGSGLRYHESVCSRRAATDWHTPRWKLFYQVAGKLQTPKGGCQPNLLSPNSARRPSVTSSGYIEETR